MTETRRGLAWAQFPGMTDRFDTITKAVKWLQSKDIGYHYQTMWRDVSTLFQKEAKLPFQRTLGPFDYLEQKMFVEKDWRRPESYNYYGNAFFVDNETGDHYFRSYSLYADTSLTDSELSEIVYGLEEEKEEGTGQGGTVIAFESLERSHKWGAGRSQGYQIAEI